MSQLWVFESPVAVTAADPVTVTWSPRTFNSVNYGNFTLNLWILREDLKTDAVINSYVPSLLRYNHSVFDNSILWIPSLNEVDVNVTQAGVHQMAWEQTKNNVERNPLNTTFEGFSQGFGVKGPASSSSTSSSTTGLSSSATTVPSIATSSAIDTSSTSSTATDSSQETTPATSATLSNSLPSQVESSSGTSTSQATILGLSIGLGCLLLLCIAGGFWGMRKYRRARQSRLTMQVPPAAPIAYTTEPKPNFTIQGGELDTRWRPRDTHAVELPNNVYTGHAR